MKPNDPRFLDLLASDRWMAERKYDGERALISVSRDGVVEWRSRSGQQFNWRRHPGWASFHRRACEMRPDRDVVMDCEACADGTVVIFDLPRSLISGPLPLRERLYALDYVTRQLGATASRRPDRAFTMVEKLRLFDRMVTDGHEGIVLKDLASTYQGGRSKSWIKVKITATADLYVMWLEPTRCKLFGWKDDKLAEFGGCGIPAKLRIIDGTMVEVEYLYVSDKGRLVQPRIVRVRPDKTIPDDFDGLRTSSKNH